MALHVTTVYHGASVSPLRGSGARSSRACCTSTPRQGSPGVHFPSQEHAFLAVKRIPPDSFAPPTEGCPCPFSSIFSLIIYFFGRPRRQMTARRPPGRNADTYTHIHTYLREQDFSVVSVSCSLVHQTDADYSSNLQNRKRDIWCLSFNLFCLHKQLHILHDIRVCLQILINTDILIAM